jgi:hypothetical protein
MVPTSYHGKEVILARVVTFKTFTLFAHEMLKGGYVFVGRGGILCGGSLVFFVGLFRVSLGVLMWFCLWLWCLLCLWRR